MAQMQILPSINGEIEAGITIRMDASLLDDRKLSIAVCWRGSAIGVIKQNAIIWALGQYQDATAKKLFINGILGIIDTGLICTTDPNEVPDGDWIKNAIVKRPTVKEQRALEPIINLEDMSKAVTIAIAIKANYWMMNHHTGQGQVVGYVKKVLEVFYPNQVTDQIV